MSVPNPKTQFYLRASEMMDPRDMERLTLCSGVVSSFFLLEAQSNHIGMPSHPATPRNKNT